MVSRISQKNGLRLCFEENGFLWKVSECNRDFATVRVALLELGQAISPLGDPDKIGKRGEYTVTKEDEMLRHYKEIFYGLIFGLGAACIDTFVDASTEHKAFWDFGPGMLLYRGLFILFGFLVGWLLWRNNQSEREFRSLMAAIQKLQRDFGPPTVIIHAQAQLLLTKPDAPLPPNIEVIVRSIHEQSLKLQAALKDSTALLTRE